MAEQALESSRNDAAENSRSTHRLIVEAARRVLMREGAAQVSAASVAREAGLDAENVNERFRTPDDLLLAVAVSELRNVSRASRAEGSERRAWMEKSGEALGLVQTIATVLANPIPAASETQDEPTRAVNGDTAKGLGQRIRTLGERQSKAAAELVAALDAASSQLSALEGDPGPADSNSGTGGASPARERSGAGFLSSARQAANEAAANAPAPRRRTLFSRFWRTRPNAAKSGKSRGRALLLACLAPVTVVAAGLFIAVSNREATPAPAVADAPPAAVASAPHVPLVLASLTRADEMTALNRLAEYANAGNPDAALLLGLKYLDGDSVAQDQSEALHWLQRGAEAGQPLAQYRLGNLYASAESVLYNPGEAARWYEAAAGQGNIQAMNNIAVAYAEGVGVAKDPEAAARWLEKAAELGFPTAQFNLGVLYERGDGVPQSAVDAYKWYAIAAASGDEEAQARRDLVRRELTPAQAIAAERAVQGFAAAVPSLNANEAPALADVVGNG